MVRTKLRFVPPKRIKEIMAKLGKDRVGFAKLIGASPRTVDGWLSKRPPSKMTGRLIEALAENQVARN